jgi:hypothetical protein
MSFLLFPIIYSSIFLNRRSNTNLSFVWLRIVNNFKDSTRKLHSIQSKVYDSTQESNLLSTPSTTGRDKGLGVRTKAGTRVKTKARYMGEGEEIVSVVTIPTLRSRRVSVFLYKYLLNYKKNTQFLLHVFNI